MSFMDSTIPALSDTLVPPIVHGTADLTNFAYQGNGYDALMERIRGSLTRNRPSTTQEAAWTYDAAIAAQLGFRRAEGLNLQDAALATSQIYRIAAQDWFHVSPGDSHVIKCAGPGLSAATRGTIRALNGGEGTSFGFV